MHGTTIEDFRFSGSYVSRYHHCHGSAVLSEAIPGFELKDAPVRRATDKGSRLHHLFEGALLAEDPLEIARMLDVLQTVRGAKRTALLLDETAYITWWFLTEKNFTAPPLPFELVSLLYSVGEPTMVQNSETDEWEEVPGRVNEASPKEIRLLSEGIRYVWDLQDNMEGAIILTEATKTAEWTATKPRTTADVVLTDGKVLHVIDLKMGTIPVEAFENEQLMYYGKTYMTTEETVHLHIIQQPKLVSESGIRTWEPTQAELNEWVKSVLDAEQAILNGDRSLNPGKHCQFCPANPYSKGQLGTVMCPAQIELLFGAEDMSVIEGKDDYE